MAARWFCNVVYAFGSVCPASECLGKFPAQAPAPKLIGFEFRCCGAAQRVRLSAITQLKSPAYRLPDTALVVSNMYATALQHSKLLSLAFVLVLSIIKMKF
jgi:hypothetical protein